MCGIAGFWRMEGPRDGDCQRLVKMAEVLFHRGPDDYGYLYASSLIDRVEVTQDEQTDFAPNVFLASRRLSVTDLSAAGRQPISNENGDIFVIFNGAIHNYVELRQELTKRGHRFRSSTDTEVLLHAYEEWNTDCETHLNGMWAYVIWDHRRRRLVCSRDRFGIKPLFTANIGGAFFFASEAKAILAVEKIAREPNLAYIRHAINADTPQEGRCSAFARIEQLPAAHNLVVTENKATETKYWNYDNQSETYDYSNPEQTFRELFYDAVKIRLRADVPISLLLSGGLDSSSVAVVASHCAPGEVRAFTARFSGFHSDESEYAQLAADHAGMPLTQVDYKAENFLDDLGKVSWHMDAPVAKGQMLARWLLVQEASKQGTILLEGQGADEFLGGYPERYTTAYLRSEFGHLRMSTMLQTFFRMLGVVVTADTRRVLRGELSDKLRSNSRPVTTELFSQQIRDLPDYASGPDLTRSPVFDDALNKALLQDHARLILPHLLHFGDAISMGYSAESRLPFLDHRLVEFVFGLPYQQKIRGGMSKYILRKSLGKELPPEILQRRRKIGFATPLNDWVKSNFQSDIAPLLRSTRLRERGIFNPKGLEALLLQFETSGVGAVRIFRCASVELWFRQFIDGEGFSR